VDPLAFLQEGSLNGRWVYRKFHTCARQHIKTKEKRKADMSDIRNHKPSVRAVKTVRAVGPNIGFIFVYSFVSPSKISY
jgi:hypothetical protein